MVVPIRHPIHRHPLHQTQLQLEQQVDQIMDLLVARRQIRRIATVVVLALVLPTP